MPKTSPAAGSTADSVGVVFVKKSALAELLVAVLFAALVASLTGVSVLNLNSV